MIIINEKKEDLFTNHELLHFKKHGYDLIYYENMFKKEVVLGNSDLGWFKFMFNFGPIQRKEEQEMNSYVCLKLDGYERDTDDTLYTKKWENDLNLYMDVIEHNLPSGISINFAESFDIFFYQRANWDLGKFNLVLKNRGESYHKYNRIFSDLIDFYNKLPKTGARQLKNIEKRAGFINFKTKLKSKVPRGKAVAYSKKLRR